MKSVVNAEDPAEVGMDSPFSYGANAGRLLGGARRPILARQSGVLAESLGLSSESIRFPPRNLKRVLQYVHDNLSSSLTLAELAFVARRSPYHFARQFRLAVGIAPHQYVIRARVEEARRLLQSEDIGIAEAAARVGFASRSHLSRHMRRLFGVTPGTYARATRAA